MGSLPLEMHVTLQGNLRQCIPQTRGETFTLSCPISGTIIIMMTVTVLVDFIISLDQLTYHRPMEKSHSLYMFN